MFFPTSEFALKHIVYYTGLRIRLEAKMDHSLWSKFTSILLLRNNSLTGVEPNRITSTREPSKMERVRGARTRYLADHDAATKKNISHVHSISRIEGDGEFVFTYKHPDLAPPPILEIQMVPQVRFFTYNIFILSFFSLTFTRNSRVIQMSISSSSSLAEKKHLRPSRRSWKTLLQYRVASKLMWQSVSCRGTLQLQSSGNPRRAHWFLIKMLQCTTWTMIS